MTTTDSSNLDTTHSINLLPRWITSARGRGLETVASSSGAALAILDTVLRHQSLENPAALLRDRLAVQAAVACLKLEGRNDTIGEIRDAVCLARAGDALGPAGTMFRAWRQVARLNLGAALWRRQLSRALPPQIAEHLPDLTRKSGSPVEQATQVLTEMLQQFPRQEAAALMLADVTLAHAVGWDRAVPLLGGHLKRGEIRAFLDRSDTSGHVHRAILDACDDAVRKAADLARRKARLEAISPKLRTKGAPQALAVFLSHDAVSPSGMLSPTITGSGCAMTDRAARRLCDRLVALGAVRELTGRATFRLYGM